MLEGSGPLLWEYSLWNALSGVVTVDLLMTVDSLDLVVGVVTARGRMVTDLVVVVVLESRMAAVISLRGWRGLSLDVGYVHVMMQDGFRTKGRVLGRAAWTSDWLVRGNRHGWLKQD